MSSLKVLVDRYGFDIEVVAPRRNKRFTIIGEKNATLYIVRYPDGTTGTMMKECKCTDDYKIDERVAA